MSKLTLKWKISIAASMLFIILIVIIGLAAIYTITHQSKEILYSHQYTLVRAIATDLDDKLITSHKSLIALAKSFPASILPDSEKAQSFLDNAAGTKSLFDRNLSIFSNTGILIAETPYRPTRRGNNFSFGEYIKETLKTGKPHISHPFVTTDADQSTVLMFTAPILNKRGEIIAIVGGSLGLTKPELLGNIAKTKIGKRGYLFLTTHDGMLIMHPNKERLMLPAFPSGSNPLFEQAQRGLEGANEATIDGAKTITSFAKLNTTNWILGGTLPLEEALTLVTNFEQQWFVFMMVGGIIVLFIIWILMSFLTRPLINLTTQIVRSKQIKPVIIESKDEIGNLAQAYNNMVESLTQRDNEIRKNEQRYRLLADNSTDMITLLNKDGVLTYVSPACKSLLGYPQELVEGHSIYEFVHPSDINLLQNGYDQILKDPEMRKAVSFRARHADRCYVWVEAISKQLNDENNESNKIISVCRDITARKELEDHLQYLACHDTLTGLPNRFLLLDRFVNAVARANRDDQPMVVMMLDLDRFKNINDTLGHIPGDSVLQETAERLKSCLRESDTLARPGGDEFVALLPSIQNVDDASIVAAKILAAFNKPFVIDDQELHLTTSIGVSIYPTDGEDLPTLLKNADTALYRAKAIGGNVIIYYQSEMNASAKQRLSLESALHGAIERNELRVYYQPITTRDKVIGMEALVRWQHPELGLVSPGHFISIAEDCGLIIPIGEWVLQTACEQALQWQKQGLPSLKLSVNLSARQFRQHNLTESIKQIVNKVGFDVKLLYLEITESTVMENPERSGATLSALKALGFNISIDDFGTGYSSLSYLKRFPIDTLKIDRSFVKEIIHDHNDSTIVKAVINLAHSLGMTVVAEGVETQEQLDFLTVHDCDAMQGYYYSQPLPKDQFFQYMENTLENNSSLYNLSQRAQIKDKKNVREEIYEKMTGLTKAE